MEKCYFLEILQWPDFEILGGHSDHQDTPKNQRARHGTFFFIWVTFSSHVYPDSILISFHIINGFSHFDAFFLQSCICWILFGTLSIIFDGLDEIIGKIIESRYISICPIIDKIIDIDGRLPQIISDFRDLSAKLSLSKMTEELSKIYRYRKKWLIAHP